MKELIKQIKFLDATLLPLFGFKSISDYDYSLKLTMITTTHVKKINDCLVQIKKLFPVKKFNLCKTDNCVQTPLQAFNFLKICLQISNVSHTIFNVKEGSHSVKVMRLNSMNNVLYEYISKMSEIRTFSENIHPALPEKSDTLTTEDLFLHIGQRFEKEYIVKIKDFINGDDIIIPFDDIDFMYDNISMVSFEFEDDNKSTCDVDWVISVYEKNISGSSTSVSTGVLSIQSGCGLYSSNSVSTSTGTLSVQCGNGIVSNELLKEPQYVQKYFMRIKDYVQTSNMISDYCVIPVKLMCGRIGNMSFHIHPQKKIISKFAKNDLHIRVVGASLNKVMTEKLSSTRSFIHDSNVKLDFVNQTIGLIGTHYTKSREAIKKPDDPTKSIILTTDDGIELTYSNLSLGKLVGPIRGNVVKIGNTTGAHLEGNYFDATDMLHILVNLYRYNCHFVSRNAQLDLQPVKYISNTKKYCERVIKFVKNFDTAYNLMIKLSKPAKIAYVYGQTGHLSSKFDIIQESDTSYKLSLTDIDNHLVAFNLEKLIIVFDNKDYEDDIEISVDATICFFDTNERTAIFSFCKENSDNNYIVNIPKMLENI